MTKGSNQHKQISGCDTVKQLPSTSDFTAASKEECFDKGAAQAGQRDAFVSYVESNKNCWVHIAD